MYLASMKSLDQLEEFAVEERQSLRVWADMVKGGDVSLEDDRKGR